MLSGVSLLSHAAGKDRCRRSFRSELSVDFMHHHFAFLILGDFSGGLHRRFLRGMVRRVPCVAFTKNSPEVFATGNDMLIFAHTSFLF